MLVPFRYTFRSLFVRRASTLLTILGIAATVATVAGVLSLQQGFASLYKKQGSSDITIFMRQGSTYEGDSLFAKDTALTLIKTTPEIALAADGQPLASMECYLAVRLRRNDGGETNIPIRGVQPKTFEIRGASLKLLEGRPIESGADEIIVGRRLVDRIPNCRVGDVLQVNVTPFRVVGVFECEGPAESEIWGDLDRMLQALERVGPNRIIARLADGTELEPLAERLEAHKETPAKITSEQEYLSSQTQVLSGALKFLSGFLGVIMGIAAVFTATNTMLSALASRTHEIGILLSTGFRPLPVFFSFLLEALLLGLIGGVVGCLLILPLSGIETGTTNWQSFTEVSFAFQVTPYVLGTAVAFSLALGLLGGAIPAWRAARMKPTEALRRR